MTRRVPDRLWVPALAGLLLALAFVAALAVRADGDLSLLVHAGPPWTDPDAAPGSLTVQPADEAFDGQFFYRLGVDPLSGDEQVAGVTFDVPSVRWSRWGFGALAHGAQRHRHRPRPRGARRHQRRRRGRARRRGRRPGPGVRGATRPGACCSCSGPASPTRSRSTPPSSWPTTFALGGLLAGHHRRWALAGVLLAAGVLTRDSTVVTRRRAWARSGLLRLVGGRPTGHWRGPFAAGAAVGVVLRGLAARGPGTGSGSSRRPRRGR